MDDASLQQRARKILRGELKAGRGDHLRTLIALGDVIEDRPLLGEEVLRIKPFLMMGGDILLIAMLLEGQKPIPALQLIRERISPERTWGMVAVLPNPVGEDWTLRQITNDLAWRAVGEWVKSAEYGERVGDAILTMVTSRLIRADLGVSNEQQREVAQRVEANGWGTSEFIQWCRSALHRYALEGEAHMNVERPMLCDERAL